MRGCLLWNGKLELVADDRTKGTSSERADTNERDNGRVCESGSHISNEDCCMQLHYNHAKERTSLVDMRGRPYPNDTRTIEDAEAMDTADGEVNSRSSSCLERPADLFWTAIGFCYYETLLRLGDKQKFLEEQARIRSLGNLLQAGGLPRDIYEDWEDEIMDLLKTLPTYHSLEEAEAALLTAFNETGPWQSIITYLKVPYLAHE